MGKASQIRELALQALYLFDASPEDAHSREEIETIVNESPYFDDEDPQLVGSNELLESHEKERAFAIAEAAWRVHKEADALVVELAPDWPTYRQPLMDRNILRLAYYEMAFAKVPQAIAINEAVELGKRYGADHSSKFINGVLDEIRKKLDAGDISPDHSQLDPTAGDAWLADALKD